MGHERIPLAVPVPRFLWTVAAARIVLPRACRRQGPDPFLGEHGRHLLTVRDGKADCVPTDRKPDLSPDVRDLGSVHLGTAPRTLVRAGHIQAHHPGAAALAESLFRSDRAPHCLHWF